MRSRSPFRAVALGTSLPRILAGKANAVAVSNVNGFGVGGGNPASAPLGNAFEAMYSQSVDSVLNGTGRETFEAVKMLKSADPQRYTPAAGAIYPKGRFGDAMRQTAQLIKSNLGVQIAFTDIGGWDHHVNEGAAEGQLANVLRDFRSPSPLFGPTSARWQKTRLSSPCLSLGARLARTATAVLTMDMLMSCLFSAVLYAAVTFTVAGLALILHSSTKGETSRSPPTFVGS